MVWSIPHHRLQRGIGFNQSPGEETGHEAVEGGGSFGIPLFEGVERIETELVHAA